MTKKYKITVHSSTTQEVSKEQYIQHLTNKFNYAMEALQDQELKLLKAKQKRQELEDKLMIISNELDVLISAEEHAKIIDYAFHRYEELYPKKAAQLLVGAKK